MIFGIVFAAILMLFVVLYFKQRTEGFIDLNVSPSLFVPEKTPGGNEERSSLSPGGADDPNTEKLVRSAELPAMAAAAAEANWGKMTSEVCYRSDIGESLKKTRNYLQRTNNYRHMHPDDCSAPNHELIGTFYTPFDGVGRYPLSGTNFPASTQCQDLPAL